MTSSPDAQPVFLMEDVSKSFGPRLILNHAALSVQPGQCAVILGGSGAGKSVLMRLMLGFITPDQGRVRVFGQLPPFSPYASAARPTSPLAVLFQNDALLEDLTIEENLLLGARAFQPALGEEDGRQKARTLLEQAGMQWETVAAQFPAQLSGGMRKRVALARALACSPKALLVDEPTSGLDVHSARQITQLLADHAHNGHTASIIITHDLDCARTLANRLFLLLPGSGSLEEIDPGTPCETIATRLEHASTNAHHPAHCPPAPPRSGAAFLESLGAAANAVAKALPPPDPRLFIHRLRQAIIDSLPLVISIFLLIGMIIFVQTRSALAPVGLFNMLPDALAEAGLKLAPAFLGLVMAGRLGSVICAEVGLLRQTEQLDAMRVLGLAPERQMLAPALWAAAAAFPALLLIAEFAALGGALLMMLVPSQAARISMPVAQAVLSEAEAPLFALGMVKAVLFGMVIVLSGYFFGARDQRGSSAIGRSITAAIVASFLAIVALDFLASFFTLGV